MRTIWLTLTGSAQMLKSSGASVCTKRIPLAAAISERSWEMVSIVEFMAELQTEDKVTKDQALTYFCLLVLNMNEFMYLD